MKRKREERGRRKNKKTKRERKRKRIPNMVVPILREMVIFDCFFFFLCHKIKTFCFSKKKKKKRNWTQIFLYSIFWVSQKIHFTKII